MKASPSKLGLKPGDKIKVSDAIKALVTKSANDVALVIAENLASTEDKFARYMTWRAKQIGMTQTTFRNASGLPNPGQRTTARDLATLALRLHDDFPEYYGYFKTRAFTGRESHRNHNSLLFSYPGTEGMKTGYIRAFRSTSSPRSNAAANISSPSSWAAAQVRKRDGRMRQLLDESFKQASLKRTRKPSKAEEPKIAKAKSPSAKKSVAAAAQDIVLARAQADLEERSRAAGPAHRGDNGIGIVEHDLGLDGTAEEGRADRRLPRAGRRLSIRGGGDAPPRRGEAGCRQDARRR